MTGPFANLSDQELIARLRRQADAWFNNNDRLMFDELIRRWQQTKNLRLVAGGSES